MSEKLKKNWWLQKIVLHQNILLPNIAIHIQTVMSVI